MTKTKFSIQPPTWQPPRWHEELATYNAECERGLVHTKAYDDRMAVLQERWDKQVAEEAALEADEYVKRRRKQIGLPVANYPLGDA